MKKVTLNIPDNKYQFFLELLRSLEFVSEEQIKELNNDDDGDTKQQIVGSIKQAAKEMKLYKEGKIQIRDAYDLIDEL